MTRCFLHLLMVCSFQWIHAVTLDQKILDDPDKFHRETTLFLESVKDEILNSAGADHKQRLDLIRQIASDEANLRAVPVKLTYKLLKDSVAQKITKSSNGNIESGRARYAKLYESSPDSEKEYGIYSMVFDLQQALNMYAGGVAAINYEERMTVAQRVNLNDQPNPRGIELREMMKEYLNKAVELRDRLALQFPAIAK